MQAWGLIVLLISKAAGHLGVDDMEEDKAAGVLHRYYIITFNSTEFLKFYIYIYIYNKNNIKRIII